MKKYSIFCAVGRNENYSRFVDAIEQNENYSIFCAAERNENYSILCSDKNCTDAMLYKRDNISESITFFLAPSTLLWTKPIIRFTIRWVKKVI